MNIIQKFIKNNNLVYKNKLSLNNNFILSKNKNSSLSFIEITNSEYRFVFEKLNI